MPIKTTRFRPTAKPQKIQTTSRLTNLGTVEPQNGAPDTIDGTTGNDLLFAYDGTRDRLNGGRGHDALNGYDPGLDIVRSIESI